MEYDTDVAAKKKVELVSFSTDTINSLAKANGHEYDDLSLQKAATEIIDNFIKITPPEREDLRMDFILLRQGGRGGGRSVKPGNLLLDMRKLMTAIASGVLTTVGIVGAPWTAPFAALLLWDRLWAGLNIEINEREAILLWVMWNNRDLNNQVFEEGLIEKVNAALESNGRPSISKQQMEDSLETLSKITAIERTTSINNGWGLRAWVRVRY